MVRRFALRAAAAVAASVVLTLAALAVAPAAGAHSALESSDPTDGAVLDASPDVITLRFNEPVQLPDDAVRLFDRDGALVDLGTTKAVDASVTTPVPDELADGSYVVAWKVMSADSHPVSGAFTFAVGAPSAPGGASDPLAAITAEATTKPVGPQAAVDVSAGLAYGGVLLAVGAALFILFVSTAAGLDTVERIVRAGSVVGAVGLVTGVVAAAAQLDGGWPSWSAFTGELTGSAGLQALIGVSGLVLTNVAVSLVRLPKVVRRVVALDGAVAALAAFVVVGHTRTASPLALVGLADVVHLAAAAVWTGGLVALLLTLRTQRDGDAAAVATTVARFSAMAGAALLAVAVAGGLLGWRIVGSWDALTSTTYGVLLMVKVGLFALLAALGAYNRFRLVGRVAGDDHIAARTTLARTLRFEIVLVVAVVGVTASFTSISPERTVTAPSTTPLTCDEVAAMEAMPGMEDMDHSCVGTTTSSLVPFDPTDSLATPVAVSGSFGDGTARVTVRPSQVGTNTVSILLTDGSGASIEPKELPTVRFRLREKEIGPITATVEQVGPGAYRVTQDFALPGTWEMDVAAVVSDFEQPQAVVEFDITG